MIINIVVDLLVRIIALLPDSSAAVPRGLLVESDQETELKGSRLNHRESRRAPSLDNKIIHVKYISVIKC